VGPRLLGFLALIFLLSLGISITGPLSIASFAADGDARLAVAAHAPNQADAISVNGAEQPPEPAILIGAGDISVCGQVGDNQTAALVDRLLVQFPQASIFTAGDNSQTIGELYEYTDCFGPSWGRFKERIHPSPGNHDWYTEHGRYYFEYFGANAGKYGLGYYSYDFGGWHIVSLNSNCDDVDCSAESPQAQWLRADLSNNQSNCTLVTWHHPLWSSGLAPIQTAVDTFWKIASDYGVEVIVNGHDHHYERFTPLDRDGNPNPVSGTREFIVGTGGAWLHELGAPLETSEVRDNTANGVIVFVLYPQRYEWYFLPVQPGAFTDSGSSMCN
jgi:acid phosphatase type 7